jgi:hypothetical protein
MIFSATTAKLNSRVDEVLHEFGKITLLGQLARKSGGLFNGRDLAGEEQPEHTLWDNFLSPRSGRKNFLAVWNRQAMEPNAL